ncbi:hypothetical protein Tco_0715289 [Tanacetum coccineum]
MGRTLLFSSSSIIFRFLYQRFTKIIISSLHECFPGHLHDSARDMYHNLQDDDIMKNIFNSGDTMIKVGCKFQTWMLTKEMKHMEIIGCMRSRVKCSKMVYCYSFSSSEGESYMSGLHQLQLLQLLITQMKGFYKIHSSRVLPCARKSQKEVQKLERVENSQTGTWRSKEIEMMMEGSGNVIDDSLPPRNDEPNIPGTRLEPRSDKESLEVEIIKDKEVEPTNDEEVEITNVIIPMNVNDEGEEILNEILGFITRAVSTEDTEKLQEMKETVMVYVKKRLLIPLLTIPKKFLIVVREYMLRSNAAELPPGKTKGHNEEDGTPTRSSDDPQQSHSYIGGTPDEFDKGLMVSRIVPQRQKTSEYEVYVSGESSSGQVNEEERGPSTLGNQEQVDDYDFWTDSYASDDDEIPTKQVSQDIMEEVSLTIDEAKLKKMADEMLRQRCTSRDEHINISIINPEAPALSLINQDLLYLKKGSSGPEKIVLSLYKFPAIIFNDDDIKERTSRWVNKCVKKFNPYARYGVEHWKNPHAKIFYIKKQKEPGKPKEEVYSNSKIIQVIKTYWELGHEHKFITEIVARRANECIVSITEPDYKNLNKNDIEDMYLLIMNGKVPDYAETGLLWSLSVFIRSSVIWERVHDFQLGIESYQQKVNLTAPTISFPGVEKHKMFSIIYEPVHGIIYKNSKKEKRVMRHSEIHKFCDATLNRVLEGLKSYNNDVKYGYVQRELTNDEVEYLKLFEEEIEVRLKYRNQMRRWEMYVNGRPLGPRRERPE